MDSINSRYRPSAARPARAACFPPRSLRGFLAEYPSVPTFAELGYPGVTIAAWAGLLAPAAAPRPILEKLALQLKQVVATPEVKERLKGLGMVPMDVALKDFDAQIAREVEAFGRIAKARGITGDE